jgi:hypothetical protein
MLHRQALIIYYKDEYIGPLPNVSIGILCYVVTGLLLTDFHLNILQVIIQTMVSKINV